MIALHGKIEAGMRFADLHLHTNLSDGKLPPEQLVEMAAKTGYLTDIAITDHGTLEGGSRADIHARRLGLNINVIRGQEIKTSGGDMIALYFGPAPDSYRGGIHYPIKDGLSPRETAKRIKRQDGLVKIPHPYLKAFGLSGFGTSGCEELLEMGIVDIWEGFNAGMAYWRNKLLDRNNQKALQTWLENPGKLGALVASSDGHGYMPGWAFTGYHGDLRQAIIEKRTVPIRLDEEGEERLARLATMYHNPDELNAVNKIRARHGLPSFGVSQQIEVVMAKAKRHVTPEDAAEFLSAKELARFEAKLRPGRPNWEASNWAASRLSAKLAYHRFHPEKALAELVIENQKRSDQVSSGAPWIPEYPDLSASLTHWGQYGAAVVAPHLVGIDVSGLRPNKKHEDALNLSDLFFQIVHPGEFYKFPSNVWDDITKVWSVKEACYKGPRTSGVRRQTAPLNLSSVEDSPHIFRVEIRDRFPRDYWSAYVVKIAEALHLAVAFPQNFAPNAYTNRFIDQQVMLDDVLRPMKGLPNKIAEVFEVSSLHQ